MEDCTRSWMKKNWWRKTKVEDFWDQIQVLRNRFSSNQRDWRVIDKNPKKNLFPYLDLYHVYVSAVSTLSARQEWFQELRI